MDRMIFWVLGFVFLVALLALGIKFYTEAQGSLKETTAITTINEIVAGTEELYTGQPDYTGVTNKLLIDAGKISASDVKSTDEIKNPWGGEIIVTSDDTAAHPGASNPTASFFDVEILGIPKAACTELAAAFSTGNLQGENIDGTQIDSVANGGTRVTPGTADTDCSADGNGNYISFAFN